MREIKFRAWIPVEDSYNEQTDKFDKYEMTYDIAFEEFEPINDLLAGVEHLMQFTGLRDKNGEEIYEGDIIRQSFYGGEVEIGRMCWNDSLARFVLDLGDTSDGWGLQAKDSGDREVIGNIYENPELLSDAKAK